MTSVYGFEGLWALISDRKLRLLQEAERERTAQRARRSATPAQPAPAARRPEVEWAPSLQGGEPLPLSHAGAGLS